MLLVQAIASLVCVSWAVYGQTAVNQQFEVTSIKPCKANDGNGFGSSLSPGRLVLNCQTVSDLIQGAYVIFANGELNLAPFPIPTEGGPAWLNSDRYTIEAVAEGTPGTYFMKGPMLQRLLENRFHLKIHRETKDVAAYALIVAKHGPKLRPLQEGSCIDVVRLPLSEQGSGKNPCGFNRGGRTAQTVTLDMPGLRLDDFSRDLAGILGRPVINKTGIAGKFDIHLVFARDEAIPGAIRNRNSDGVPASASSKPAGTPSIFTAIQEQLGLRLKSTKGLSEFFVIDHVEKPSEN